MDVNNQTTLKLTANLRSPNLISNYEWKINETLQQNNTDTLVIHTSNLPLGDNTISLRAQTSPPCNKWSEPSLLVINIKEVNMEKIVKVDVNKPLVTVTIVAEDTATLEVTVNNQMGTPRNSATVIVDGVTQTTGPDGKTTFNNVIQGLQKDVIVRW